MLALFWALAGGCSNTLHRGEYTRLVMGVQCRVVVYGRDEPATRRAAASAFAELARLEQVFSDYRDDSELARLNAAAGGEPVPASPDMVRVLTAAGEVSSATGGAFDATVGPLSRLWRQARATGRAMPAEERASALALVDWRAVELRGGRVRLAKPGMRLDLGGIAKGYAARAAVDRLEELGHPRSMVALAGDVAVGRRPPGRRGWTIELPAGSSAGPLVVERVSVSTSGHGEQFVEIEGRRVSHILDPRTGEGGGQPFMATVVSADGAHADAIATALVLLEPSEQEVVTRAFPSIRVLLTPVGR